MYWTKRSLCAIWQTLFRDAYFWTACMTLVREENWAGTSDQKILRRMLFAWFTIPREYLKTPVRVHFEHVKGRKFRVPVTSAVISWKEQQMKSIGIIPSTRKICVKRLYHMWTLEVPGQIKTRNLLVEYCVENQCQPRKSAVHPVKAREEEEKKKGTIDENKNRYHRNQIK